MVYGLSLRGLVGCCGVSVRLFKSQCFGAVIDPTMLVRRRGNCFQGWVLGYGKFRV